MNEINKFLKSAASSAEKESWAEKTSSAYRVVVIVGEYGLSKDILAIDLPRPNGYEHGITKEQALKMAGKNGVVHLITTTSRRLQ